MEVGLTYDANRCLEIIQDVQPRRDVGHAFYEAIAAHLAGSKVIYDSPIYASRIAGSLASPMATPDLVTRP